MLQYLNLLIPWNFFLHMHVGSCLQFILEVFKNQDALIIICITKYLYHKICYTLLFNQITELILDSCLSGFFFFKFSFLVKNHFSSFVAKTTVHYSVKVCKYIDFENGGLKKCPLNEGIYLFWRFYCTFWKTFSNCWI